MSPQALLITGTVGAGKTSVAAAVGTLLVVSGVPHAVIDLDGLRTSWPSPPGDPFNSALELRNLRAVAANYVDSGAEVLVLAGVVESRADRARYQGVVGLPLTVVRLHVELDTVRARLRRRHDGEEAARRWHLARCGELAAILQLSGVEDLVVDATHGSIVEVAEQVRQRFLDACSKAGGP